MNIIVDFRLISLHIRYPLELLASCLIATRFEFLI